MAEMAIFLLFSYLLGSVPFGLIFSRLKGVDPRKMGSGNIGATNVMRAAGKSYGLLTLLCDILKGFLPVYIAKYIGFSESVAALMGFASFIGHILPLSLKFRGGKGVATALGVFLAFNPLASAIALAIFVSVVIIWRYVSLGSLVSSISFPFLLIMMDESKEVRLLAALVVAIVVLRHSDNIARLVAGKENKLRL